jgi:ankyrin repeat protein
MRQLAKHPHIAHRRVRPARSSAYDKDFRTVKAMLSHGVSISATDHSEWRTAPHAAAIAGDLRTIQFLVSNGADVNALDRAGDSPAELAASRGH